MKAPHGSHAKQLGRSRPSSLVVMVATLVVAVGSFGIYRAVGSTSPGRASAASSASPARHRADPRPSRSASAATRPCTVSATLVPSCGAWWGMFLRAETDSGWVRTVGREERFLGQRLDIIEQYYDMSTSDNGVFPTPGATRLARDHLLLFNWTADIWSSGVHLHWRDIASGALDSSVIIPTAERLRAFHHPVFLALMTEPDGEDRRQGSSASYVAAYRHIHTVFAQAGVHNVVWVWATEGFPPNEARDLKDYPGNAYVDWVGYDPYNFFTCHANGWHWFPQTVQPFYEWIMKQPFHSKPIMLPEFGSMADPRDPQREADWFDSVVPTLRQMPDLKALVEWNANVPGRPGCDLELSTDPAAAQAYRQTGLDPYFQHTSLLPTRTANPSTSAQRGAP